VYRHQSFDLVLAIHSTPEPVKKGFRGCFFFRDASFRNEASIPKSSGEVMARKNPQQFIKRQKEMERAQKAREKMAKRHRDKKDDELQEGTANGHSEETLPSES